MKDAVDSGCRTHGGPWGVRSRDGAVRYVVRIHPLALKHAGAFKRHRNTQSLENDIVVPMAIGTHSKPVICFLIFLKFRNSSLIFRFKSGSTLYRCREHRSPHATLKARRHPHVNNPPFLIFRTIGHREEVRRHDVAFW